jgi:hypothetical protein
MRGRYSHISPITGRNKRETGKLIRRVKAGGTKGGQIRKLSDGTGRPAEKRITAARRRRLGR